MRAGELGDLVAEQVEVGRRHRVGRRGFLGTGGHRGDALVRRHPSRGKRPRQAARVWLAQTTPPGLREVATSSCGVPSRPWYTRISAALCRPVEGPFAVFGGRENGTVRGYENDLGRVGHRPGPGAADRVNPKGPKQGIFSTFFGGPRWRQRRERAGYGSTLRPARKRQQPQTPRGISGWRGLESVAGRQQYACCKRAGDSLVSSSLSLPESPAMIHSKYLFHRCSSALSGGRV